MTPRKVPVTVRNTQPQDFEGIREMCRLVYTDAPPWTAEQLSSHLRVFPEGQFVAIDESSGKVVGMSASLIVQWDDYDLTDNWKDFTDSGMFTNHDPENGRTLYAAEVMVHPDYQGHGIGKKLYKARRELVRRLGLRRIRAGARLRGYHKYADNMTPQEYVLAVIRGEIGDPTLSFQLKQGFRVVGVTSNYLFRDNESQGHAAVIEWINHQVAQRRDYARRDPAFGKPRKPRSPSSPGDGPD